MRLFFSVNFPAAVCDELTSLQTRLRARIKDDGVRWAKPAQFHLTIKFLGEVDYKRAGIIVDAATELVTNLEPFEVALGGVGAFPSAERPSVLWIGVAQGRERLDSLAAAVNDKFAVLGFSREHKELKPHITLARIRSYAGETAARRVLASGTEDSVSRFVVSQMSLMRSDPDPGGSIYTAVDEFPFRGSNEPALVV
jgi:2'-5' RNA ligase